MNAEQPTPPPIIRVSASATRALRHAVLRPNQPLTACAYPGDDDPTSIHLGIADPTRTDGTLIAIASFYREPTPTTHADNPTADDRPCTLDLRKPDLRIRGMAVLPDHRGKGLGSALIDEGIRIARGQSPIPMIAWCNARTTACGYYEKLGFARRGDEFEIEGIGPHFVMSRGLEAGSP